MEYSESLNALMKNPAIANLVSGKSIDSSAAVQASLNWAYDQTLSDDLPLGLVNAMQLADEYRREAISITEASNNLIKNELSKVSGVGLLTSLGGLYTLPLNLTVVFLIQFRMVNAIAFLAGRALEDEETRQLAHISLLGANISKVAKQKMLEGGLEKLLPKIAEKLAPKMLGKGGILKCIPILSGIIGTSFDVLTTYGVVKAAQAYFLGDIIQQEALINMQEQRIKLLINMSHIDNELVQEEESLIRRLIEESDFSDEKRIELYSAISERTPFKIDFSPFKEEKCYAVNVVISLVSVINADGKVLPAERLYLMEIAKELNISKSEIEDIMNSCNP